METNKMCKRSLISVLLILLGSLPSLTDRRNNLSLKMCFEIRPRATVSHSNGSLCPTLTSLTKRSRKPHRSTKLATKWANSPVRKAVTILRPTTGPKSNWSTI